MRCRTIAWPIRPVPTTPIVSLSAMMRFHSRFAGMLVCRNNKTSERKHAHQTPLHPTLPGWRLRSPSRRHPRSRNPPTRTSRSTSWSASRRAGRPTSSAAWSAPRWARSWVTQFVIENKTGAGGAIATQDVARAAPDGYTLLNTPVATVANEFLSKIHQVRIRQGHHRGLPAGRDRQHPGGQPRARREDGGRPGQARQGEAGRRCNTPPPAAARRRISPASCSTWPPASRPSRCTTGAAARP